MELQTLSLALLILLVGLLLLGLEIAFAMGITACAAFAFFIAQPQWQIPWSAWLTLNSFELLAMPFFIFMGSVISNSGTIGPIFVAAERILGRTPGGLVTAVIVSNALFGAMSGSSVGAAATFAAVAYPEMEKRGYEPRLAIGAIAAAGTLSVLIPPSLLFIVYGVWEGISVAKLFAAGVLPGLLLTGFMILTVLFYALLRPGSVPKLTEWTWREKLVSVRNALPWLALIVCVLGAVFGGVMTPTEASALGAVLSMVIAFIFRRLNYEIIKKSVLMTVEVTGMICFLLFSARLLAYVFGYAGLPNLLSTFLLNLGLSKYVLLILICVFYVILGCFIDSLSMMVLTLPFVIPVLESLRFDLVWWGVIFVILAEMGLVTPPFGLNLFVVQGILRRYTVGEVAKGASLFLVSMAVVITLLIIWPEIALVLPRVFFG